MISQIKALFQKRDPNWVPKKPKSILKVSDYGIAYIEPKDMFYKAHEDLDEEMIEFIKSTRERSRKAYERRASRKR